MFIVLITKSYDKSVWCNFSVHCQIIIITLALKRNTNSQKILSLHPYLIQISQSHIINISYLVSIEDNNCILLPPFNEMELLQVSKSFMKKLKEKYPCI